MGLGKRIGEECKEAGITLRQLAIKADIPYSTLYSAVKRDSDGIDAGTITRLANALGLPISYFYSDPEEGEAIISRERGALEELAQSVRYSLKKVNSNDCLPDAEILNKILDDRIPFFAKKFLIPEDILKVDGPDYVKQYLSDEQNRKKDIPLTLPEVQIQMLKLMDSMNSAGQQTAVERVEELAQLPKYQKAPAGDSTQSAGTGDENDPE